MYQTSVLQHNNNVRPFSANDCQVDHNNRKAQRNWDFLTACKPDYEKGVANWYAAPGDKCFHTIMHEQKGQHNFINKCKGLSAGLPGFLFV